MSKFLKLLCRFILALSVTSIHMTGASVRIQQDSCMFLRLEVIDSWQHDFPDAYSSVANWYLAAIAWHPNGNLIATIDKLETLTNVSVWDIKERRILFEMYSTPSG